MPSREAKKKFGDKLIFAETDFGWYGRISQRVFDVLKKYCDTFEEYSIDE
jgi:nucleotidyltransferase/DNA polymerase involved in DNA repair